MVSPLGAAGGRRFRTLAMALVFLVLAPAARGAAEEGASGAGRGAEANESVAVSANASGAVGGAADASEPWEPTLKAGQALILKVPLDTAAFINGKYPIDEMGMVELPVLGKLYVHGKKASEMENYLGQKLSNYLKDTHMTVTPAIRLAFLGHWQRPGMHYVDESATVWDAVYKTGGPASERNLKKLHLRRGAEKETVLVLESFSAGMTLAKAGIRSGDIFVIPTPDDKGFWYWFNQGLQTTAQIATIATAMMTAYLTYEAIER